MQRIYLFLIGIIIFVKILPGQESKQYSFNHLGVRDGLAAYNTLAILQDKEGFMWMATINGLQRYDGQRFVTFRHNANDPRSIPDNFIQQLLLDKFNNLWLVLNDGSIGIFDTKKFVFHPAKIKLSNPNNLQSLRSLIQDTEGNIMLAYFLQELVTYNRLTNEFSAANNIFTTPLNWKSTNVLQDPTTKKYWIGTDSGFVVFNKKTGALSYSGHNTEAEPMIDQLGKVPGVAFYKIDKKRRLWFLSWPVNVGASRLYCYDLAKHEVVLDAYDLVSVAKSYIEPSCFLEQQDGTIWIIGLNIFAKYNEVEKKFEMVPHGFGNEQSIHYESALLFEDQEQNIWVATSNNGVYVFNPTHQLFTSYKHINRVNNQTGGGYLLSFEQMRNGTILTGVWGDGIYRYDSNFNNLPLNIKGIDEINGLPVWDICKLNDASTTWLVGQPGFIYVYNESTGTAKRYEPSIFDGRTIRQAKLDKSGNIWLGSQSKGLIKWVAAKAGAGFEDAFQQIKAVSNTRVKKIKIDRNGFVWVCTNKEGVYKINPANDSIEIHLSKKAAVLKRLLSNDADDVFEYNDSLVIIAAGGLNIYNTKTNTIQYITAAEGLPSDAVVSIEKDKKGYLWLGMLNGLCRMNLETKTFAYFDRSDGMSNDNFQVAASYQLPDGRMMFGTSNDFVVFKPDKISDNNQPPDVTITDFKLLDRSLLVDSLLQLSRVELTAAQNSIIIGFASLSYSNKNKLDYYFMLEDIDKTWRKASELNQAIYNYLPPGKYTFYVKAVNADGIANLHNTELIIRIKPPFWKTWWFVGLLAFVLVGLLYWLDKFRVERIRETESVRTRIATSLTKDMSSTLNNINLLSEMAKIKMDKDIERTREYINQISNNSNRMIEVMDDMIWSINPENDELQYTISRMKRYASEIQSKYIIEINFELDEKVHDLKLHMDRRHELFLIFKEALLNAGLHSKGKFVVIKIRLEKGKITMCVIDDGIGFDTADVPFGRGLNEIRNRVDLLNADLEIKSEINTGSTVKVVLEV